MKVISGKYKGRTLAGYDMAGTRPTMDRVKESLFAIIQQKVKSSIVLDLFSGTGNLGIEALSEGANAAYLVDKNKKAYETIKKNIKTLNIENAYLYCLDYKEALKKLHEEEKKFDIIFLDPPYKTDYIEKSIERIEKYQLLKEDGIIICESDDMNKIIYSDHFEIVKSKKYGDKFIAILKEI